jgi:hypothetical protein
MTIYDQQSMTDSPLKWTFIAYRTLEIDRAEGSSGSSFFSFFSVLASGSGEDLGGVTPQDMAIQCPCLAEKNNLKCKYESRVEVAGDQHDSTCIPFGNSTSFCQIRNWSN